MAGHDGLLVDASPCSIFTAFALSAADGVDMYEQETDIEGRWVGTTEFLCHRPTRFGVRWMNSMVAT